MSSEVVTRMLQKPTMVIAHGGGRAYGPSNSLFIIEKSISLGVDMVEIDVHLTKDRVPVVIHDHFLGCTDIKLKFPRKRKQMVSDFTLKELKKLDIGTWFLAELCKESPLRVDYLQNFSLEEQQKYITAEDIQKFQAGIEIPTLEEVMQVMKKSNTLINVEIKQLPRRYPDMVNKTMDVIDSFQMRNQTIVSCFDHEHLAKIKKIAPDMAIGALVREKLYSPHLYCKTLGSEAYNISCFEFLDAIGIHSEYYQKNKKLPTNKCLEMLHKNNIGINVWTVNEKEHMQAMISQPYVSGIFTDYPHRLHECLNNI